MPEADGEAEARAAGPLAGVELLERLEDPRRVVRRDADPRVGDDDLDQHRAVRDRARGRREADRAPLGELEGVAREVDEDLLHLGAVAQDRARELGSALDLDLDALGRGLASEHPLDLVERRPGIEPILDELGVAGLDLGHLEQVVHERQQVLPARVHDPDLLLLRPAERGVALEDLRVAQDDVQRVADLVRDVGEKLALGPVGALGFILGVAELARARRDELLQPLAVGAELGHVVHLSDDAQGPTVGIGDDRHGEQHPNRLTVVSEQTFLDGVGRDVEQTRELHLVGPEVVRVRDVAQPSGAELLGRPPEHTAEREVDPEEPSVEREQAFPIGPCSKAASNCLSVAATRAPRAEYSRARKNATQSTLIACGKAPGYGARTFAKSTRIASVNPARIAAAPMATRIAPARSASRSRGRRRIHRPGPPAPRDIGGRGTRRAACGSAAGPCRPRAAASFAARGRFHAAAPIGSGRRGRPAARDERAEDTVAATAEVRIELEEQRRGGTRRSS